MGGNSAASSATPDLLLIKQNLFCLISTWVTPQIWCYIQQST